MSQDKPLQAPALLEDSLRDFYRREKQEPIPSEVWEKAFASIPLPPPSTSSETFAAPEGSWFSRLREKASRLREKASRFGGWSSWLPLGVSAAALVLILRVLPWEESRPSRLAFEPGGERPKGGPSSFTLYFSRKTAEGFQHKEDAKPGEILREGDLIQVGYVAPQPLHFLLLSLNQRGEVSAIVPLEAKESLPLPKGRGTLPKEGSLALDENLGLELFLFLVSDAAFSFATAQKAVEAAYQKVGGDLRKLQTIPGPWSSHPLLIVKASGGSAPQAEPRERPHHAHPEKE